MAASRAERNGNARRPGGSASRSRSRAGEGGAKVEAVSSRGNSRLQIFDADGKFIAEWKQFGRPSGLYIDKNDKLYVIDADSSPATNPGWKKGIRIGNAKDGKVVAFVPGHQTDNPDGAAGEGIVADPAGNLYAAENTLRGVTKYAKQ